MRLQHTFLLENSYISMSSVTIKFSADFLTWGENASFLIMMPNCFFFLHWHFVSNAVVGIKFE